MLGYLFWVVIAACNTPKASSVSEAFEQQGFVTQVGKATDFQIADCAFLDRCFGNNASAPYLLFNLPGHSDDPSFLPENTVGEIPRVPAEMRSQYYLADNEALVITGKTPPQARYFGFTPYLFSRLDSAGERISVFASLTDTLNPVNALAGVDGPFDSEIAVIYTSDAESMANARSALQSQGYSSANINEVVLPREGMNYGFDSASSDTFLLMGRVALFDEPEKGELYLEDLPLQVYRLTPEADGAGSALSVVSRVSRGDGSTEDALQPGLEQLGEAIIAAAQEVGEVQEINIASSELIAQIIDPEVCIENVTECKGDNTDTTYAAGPLSVIQADGTNTLAADEYFVVYGVNHTAAGKSTYSNFSVYTKTKRIGVVAVDSDDMAGSAESYLPDRADQDNYFAYEVRRDCTDRSHCLQLNTEFPGAALDESLFFIFRAYMNPGLSVSPDHDEILTERVIHVKPR